MKVKVSAGFSGVISKGSFENARPSYNAEIETDIQNILEISLLQEQLQEICLARFKHDEERLIVERIERERKDLRFYGSYPSVTSIIGWDADFFVSPEQLIQYASHGNLYHAQVENYIKTGLWEDVEKIDGTWSDLVIVKKGDLGLTVNDYDFPAFLKKHPIKDMQIGKSITSDVHKFGGTPDIRVCVYDGKKTLADVKRTPDKGKHFKQCAAYIIAEEENGESPYEQMMLIPANGKTEQGFSKPIVSTEISQFKSMFLREREQFHKRFGI
jgi:hypothetical protein